MPDIELSDSIQDNLAEAATFCLLISGETAASTILRDTQATDYIAYDGAIRFIVECAHELHNEQAIIDFISIRDRMQQKGFLTRVGGESNLYQLSQKFRVVEGRIGFEVESETILADVSRVAAIIKEKSRKRVLYRAAANVSKALLPNPENGIQPISADQGCNQLREAINVTESRATSFAVRISSVREQVNSRLGPLQEGEFAGKSLGMPDFDRMTGGARGNDYILIGAQDKGGKSSLALQWLSHLVKTGNPGAYVSFELDQDLIIARLIALNSNGRLPFWKIWKRMMTSEERDLALDIWDTISRWPLFIIEGKEGKDALVEVERLIQTEGLIASAWDFIQRGCELEERAISKLSLEIANLGLRYRARDYFNIVCAQLNDAGAKQQRLTGTTSLNYLYLSNQPKKDCTLGMTLMIEPEIFICSCEDQTKTRRVAEGGKIETFVGPKWEKRPTNDVCPDCVKANAANPYVRSLNPTREARLSVDRARSQGQGDYIPLRFNGEFYRFDSMSAHPVQPARREASAEDGAIMQLLLESEG